MRYANAAFLAAAALFCATAAAQTETGAQAPAAQPSAQGATTCERAERVSRAVDGILGLFAPQSRARATASRAANSAGAACAALNTPASEPSIEEPSEASPESPDNSGDPAGLGGPDTQPQSE